jgi:hypothetical protein
MEGVVCIPMEDFALLDLFIMNNIWRDSGMHERGRMHCTGIWTGVHGWFGQVV